MPSMYLVNAFQKLSPLNISTTSPNKKLKFIHSLSSLPYSGWGGGWGFGGSRTAFPNYFLPDIMFLSCDNSQVFTELQNKICVSLLFINILATILAMLKNTFRKKNTRFAKS